VKFKLDENIGGRGAAKLAAHGHDVATVAAQNLCSTSDLALIEVCRVEGRCLVTFDLDFSNPVRFPPRSYAGIVVLRLPARSGLAEIDAALETLAASLGNEGLGGKLWIVELNRIREYADESLPDDDQH
jgi:predicted nuclease of predicted toxin-antitoxin system